MRSNSKEARDAPDDSGVRRDESKVTVPMRCPFAAHRSKEERNTANVPSDPRSANRSPNLEHDSVLLEPTVVKSLLDKAEETGCAEIARIVIPAIELNESLETLILSHLKAMEAFPVLKQRSPITNDLRSDDEKTYDSYFGIERVDGDASVFVQAVITAFGRAFLCDGMDKFEGLPWLRASERELLRLAIDERNLYTDGNHE